MEATSVMSTVREVEGGPLRLVYGEWVEVADDLMEIREKSIYLLVRAENRRRFEQSERATLMTFDFTCMNIGYGGFTQTKLENGKIKLELNVHLIEERAGDSYLDDDTGQLKEFKPLAVSRAN